MIKIRYSELPAGLHVRAEVEGQSTVIYLVPGLTPVQRRSALARARSSARLGYGPELPRAGVLAAIAVDRIRTTLGNGVAALRAHPLFFVPPMAIMVSAILVCVLLASLNIRVGPLGTGRGAGAEFGFLHFGGGDQPRPGSAGPSGRPRSASGRTASSRPESGLTATVPPQYPAAPSPAPSPDPSPDPSPSSSSSSPPSGTTSAPPPSTPPPSAPPAPSPSPSSSCLNPGPLGLCIQV